MTKMTFKEVLKTIGAIIGWLILAAAFIACWVGLGLFLYCWII